MVWGVFKDTELKKAQAEKAVLFKAKQKGNMEKYGVVDLAAEIKKFEEGTESGSGSKPGVQKTADQSEDTQALTMNIDYSSAENDKEGEKAVKTKKPKLEKQKKQPKVKRRQEK